MDYTQILTTSENHIFTISLHRPDLMNAYTPEMSTEIIHALDTAEADDDVRCVILTGEGDNFCAGADLSTFLFAMNADEEQKKQLGSFENFNHAGNLAIRLLDSKKPVISAIRGAAVGIGSTMILPTDFRLCSEDVRFGFIFTRRGVVPEACSTFFLPKLVGMTKASEWMITGRIIGAEEAKEAGLVNSVHKPEDLMPAALELAKSIVEKTSPVSVALTRQLLWRVQLSNDINEAFEMEARAFAATLLGKDAVEGVQSFLEKRPPEFKGKLSKDMPDFYPWWKDK